jgi:PASTA domain
VRIGHPAVGRQLTSQPQNGAKQPPFSHAFSDRAAHARHHPPISRCFGAVHLRLNGDRKPELVTARDTSKSVSVLINAAGRCAVPDVRRTTVSAAKQAIARTNCRLGKIRGAYSHRVKAGRVISERPRSGTVVPKGSRVDLVVSRGRKR